MTCWKNPFMSMPQLATQQQQAGRGDGRAEYLTVSGEEPLTVPSTTALSTFPFSIFSPASGLRASGGLKESPLTWTGQTYVGFLAGKQRNSM